MSRFSTFLRRVFRGSAVLRLTLKHVAPRVLADVRAGRARTDKEIRESATRHATEFLAETYPGYEFIIEPAVVALIDIVRSTLRRHSVSVN